MSSWPLQRESTIPKIATSATNSVASPCRATDRSASRVASSTITLMFSPTQERTGGRGRSAGRSSRDGAFFSWRIQ